MALQVNQSLSAQENILALVQHTWPDAAEFLTEEHVTVTGGIAVDGTTDQLSVLITGISDQVVGVKEATYSVTSLTDHSFSFDDVETEADAKAAVEAYIASNLACLTSEVEVADAVEVDGQFRVDVNAAAGAITVAGSKLVWVGKVFEPLDLENDLTGTELDGFEQIAQQ